jgi:glycosyltransferase involved in cell wall biosynthesis
VDELGEEARDPRLIVMAPTPAPVFGQSVLTVSLLASLRRLRLLAAHVDTRDDRTLANLNSLDVENVRLGLLAAWRLIGAMRRFPGAAVYVQVSQGRWGFLRDALWLWIARAGRRRVYLHLHGGRFHDFHAESSPPMRWVIGTTVRRAHEAWVLTPELRRCFEGLLPAERIKVLGNVVEDPTTMLSHPLGPRRGEAGGLRVLFLSNLRDGKGHRELLEALARLGARAAGWQVRIVGDCDEPTRAAAESLVAERIDPSVRVEITGSLTGPAKARELAWANVFAFPTHYRNEGQPLVVLEALAAGLPIVSTRHRGIPDTVTDGVEALLTEPGDVDALAKALLRLEDDEGLRARMAAAARARWEDRYAPERLDEGLSELLKGWATRPRFARASSRSTRRAASPW